MRPAAIRAERLTRRFGPVTALHPLDLTVAAGEALAILGPNGAGKTTLLRLCGTLLRPSAGRVELFGIDLRSAPASVRGRIGVLSHQSFLYPDLSPAENLLFYGRMFGLADPSDRAAECIERVGLRGWAQRPVRTLSRGLEQRCALARALLHDPELLLLDEPFSGLDLDATESIEVLLREEQSRGVTIVLTTHDLARGFALCQRAIVLVRGKLRHDGALSGAERPAFEQHYAALARLAR